MSLGVGGAAPPACPDAELQPHPGIRNSGDGQGRSLVPGDGSPPTRRHRPCRETPTSGLRPAQALPGGALATCRAAGCGPSRMPGQDVCLCSAPVPPQITSMPSRPGRPPGEATGEPGSSGRALCSTVVPGGWGRPRPGLHQVSSWGRAHVKECPAHSPTAHHSFIHSFARSASRQRTPAGRLGTNVPRATAGHRDRSTSCHRSFQDKHIHTLQTLQRAKPPVSPQERPFGRPCFCDANLEEVPGLGQPPAPQV